MADPVHILAIDQGTTSTRSIVFDRESRPIATAQTELQQFYPRVGWVEHDPEQIWRDTLATARQAIKESGVGARGITAIGIANQRETVVIWDRVTGEPIHRAIVWQDRRTTEICAQLRADGVEQVVQQRTGLRLDPYFSATKASWILNAVPGARQRAERGALAFGTIDCFLLWRLTGGAVHATDVTNAARTMLYDIRRQDWDDELCELLQIPCGMLPEVHDNSHIYGATVPELLGQSIPIAGMAGDQQAALFGQTCFNPGMSKATYGTGCFTLLNTGSEAPVSGHNLITTPAYRLGGEMTYALEGSIFAAGAAVKWLRDGLGIITHARDTDGMAAEISGNDGVYMVPAFVGLGAPYWDPEARASILGLTFGSTAAHLARAALEAVAYQTLDLTDAMKSDGCETMSLRIDGGMAANDWLCQFLADIRNAPVERPLHLETTALGASYHAGLAVGLWPNLDALSQGWTAGGRFEPRMRPAERCSLLEGWRDAIARTLSKQATSRL